MGPIRFLVHGSLGSIWISIRQVSPNKVTLETFQGTHTSYYLWVLGLRYLFTLLDLEIVRSHLGLSLDILSIFRLHYYQCFMKFSWELIFLLSSTLHPLLFISKDANLCDAPSVLWSSKVVFSSCTTLLLTTKDCKRRTHYC